MQHGRNIIHTIQVAFVVMGVARVQQIGRNGAPVQLKGSVGGGAIIETGLPDTATIQTESFTEHGRGFEIAMA